MVAFGIPAFTASKDSPLVELSFSCALDFCRIEAVFGLTDPLPGNAASEVSCCRPAALDTAIA
jgi:hypothetical protein